MDKITVTYIYLIYFEMHKNGINLVELAFRPRGLPRRKVRKLAKLVAKRKGGRFKRFLSSKIFDKKQGS